MGSLSIDRRRKARQVIVGTLDAAVKGGKLAEHRCADIELYDDVPKGDRSDFVFPAFSQVTAVADAVGIAVWLMRGCGLRIQLAARVRVGAAGPRAAARGREPVAGGTAMSTPPTRSTVTCSLRRQLMRSSRVRIDPRVHVTLAPADSPADAVGLQPPPLPFRPDGALR